MKSVANGHATEHATSPSATKCQYIVDAWDDKESPAGPAPPKSINTVTDDSDGDDADVIIKVNPPPQVERV